MRKLLAGLLIGALVGSTATYYYLPADPAARFADIPARDIQNVPEISVAAAEVHRRDRYGSIRTIEDTLALPTDFAETEALYVLAGRADADEVQNLIHQAARIRDRTDRHAALRILFLRLTELDPRSALAITRTPAFDSDDGYERAVWIAWGRLDLTAALAVAENGTAAQKSLAAQSLYAATRGVDSAKTQQIRVSLGVAPGASARAEELYALAEESPMDAIKYIEALGSIDAQQEHFAMLAYHLNRMGTDQKDYAELIQSASNRQIFEQAMAAYRAQADPEAMLDEYLTASMTPQIQPQVYAALQQLARQDPGKALAYLDRLPVGSERTQFGIAIAAEIARSDPQRAIAWARDNEVAGEQTLLGSVVGAIARHDPSQAAQMLASITEPSVRQNIVGQLGGNWAYMDIEAALAWASSLSAEDRSMALQAMGKNLVYSNIDQAIGLLQRFPESGASGLKFEIAQNLAGSRSIDSAQAFIAPYKGTDEYAKLQLSVMAGAAQSDPAGAQRLLMQLDLTDAERAQYQQFLDRSNRHELRYD